MVTLDRGTLGALTVAAVVLVGSSARAELTSDPLDWNRAGGAMFFDGPEGTAATADPFAEDYLAGAPAALDSPRQPYAAAIDAAAVSHNLDPKLLHALVLVESGYRPLICSPAGACGMTQLMPATARELGVVDRFDPADNLSGGADYLVRQLRRFGDLRLALAAYNAGPARVARLGRVPAIAETETYVALVIDCYLALAAGRSLRGPRDCGAPR